MLCAVAAAVTLFAIPPRRSADYVLTDREETRVRAAFKSERFPTASEAAYAASLNYGRALLSVEVGAKIYVDIVQGAIVYSYGPPIYGESDNESGEEEILYDPRANDGHFQLVGFWHEHPSPDDWLSLYGHYSQVEQTHQTVWTTIRHDLFVQFWDGTRAMPTWTHAVPAIQPIARV